jgi:membrane-bound serine protease (ClpP class)
LRLIVLKTLAVLLLAQGCWAAPRVLVLPLDGVVHPVTTEIVSRAIDRAVQQEAELLILRLNTPGGLMDAMRQTIERMVASPVPIAVFVAPSGGRASSAGFFLLQAADIAAMAPGTNTGAASPVLMGQEMDETMRRKVESDAAAYLRSLAEKRGRNSELAQKTVLEAQSFTEQEALRENLIDLIAESTQDLVQKLHGREVTRFTGQVQKLNLENALVEEYELSTRERFLTAIANPNLALVLLVLGALGIYIEFTSPGLIFPGVAGAIMALLGLTALAVFPINWLGAALMVLAIILFVLEATVTSGGILGVGGAVSMTLGALLLIDSPIPEMRIQLPIALAVAVPFALISIFLVSLIVRASKEKVATGMEGMIGKTGIAQSALAPSGMVFVHGEYWSAVATAPVEAGALVRVTAVKGLRLTVEPVTQSLPGA